MARLDLRTLVALDDFFVAVAFRVAFGDTSSVVVASDSDDDGDASAGVAAVPNESDDASDAPVDGVAAVVVVDVEQLPTASRTALVTVCFSAAGKLANSSSLSASASTSSLAAPGTRK